MFSDQILITFPPIEFDKPLAFLKNMSCSLNSLIDEFSTLSMEEIASYEIPSYVSEIKENYLNSIDGKKSNGYKEFNTVITAIGLLKSCAQINMAIYALRNKYLLAEELYNKQSYKKYGYNNPFTGYLNVSWHNSTDENVIRIKNAAIETRDKIHGFSKKYTVEGFEENFINTFKYRVYGICDKFYISTQTLTEKTVESGSNILVSIITFALFCLLFGLVAKCATG